MVEQDRQPDDEQMCELLDRYVGALQSGDEQLRQTLETSHPEIVHFADYLKALDNLSAPDANGKRHSNVEAGLKLAQRSTTLGAHAQSDPDRSAPTILMGADSDPSPAGNATTNQSFAVRNEF